MLAFFRRLWVFMQPYKGRLLLGLLCAGGFAITSATAPLVMQIVPDVLFAEDVPKALAGTLEKYPEWIREPVIRWVTAAHAQTSQSVGTAIILLIPLLLLLRGVFDYLQAYLMNWVGVRAVAAIRDRLFSHLQNLSVSFFHDARSGELISRITNDTTVLLQIMRASIATMVREPLTLLALIVMLLYKQPTLTLVSLVVFPVCVVPMMIFGRKVRKSTKAAQEHLAEMTDLMQESFAGNRIIKAYNLEAQAEARFRQTLRKFVSQHMRIVRAQEMPGPMIEFCGGVGVALLLIYIFHWASQRPTVGDFSMFIFSIFMMYQPIKNLSRLHTQLEQARAASARVFDLLDQRNNVSEPAAPKPLRAAGAEVRFENVEFSYGDKPVLRGINLTIRPGQLVALVGRSGSGKTTMANLLLRFYDPARGRIRIGETDLREVSTKDLRGQIAVVTQENILFNESIRWNIAAGRAGATEAEIVDAAKHAHAHEFIMEKPGGFDALIGERGVSLSGGQRQRLAIARALVRNAPILILDEATSALDSESERAVQEALEELMQGRTTICIAHRLSTIQRADQIVVLDQGQVVEMGTHTELLERRGAYFNLHSLAAEGAE